MRTIDADALIEQMEADAEHIDDPICKMFAYAAVSDVKHAPTIEPQRMRGKWVRTVLGSTNGYGTTVMYQCSECECMSISKYNYCPNCGADMRETE